MGEVRDELNRNLKRQQEPPPDGLPDYPGSQTVDRLLTGAAAVGGALLGRGIGRKLGRAKFTRYQRDWAPYEELIADKGAVARYDRAKAAVHELEMLGKPVPPAMRQELDDAGRALMQSQDKALARKAATHEGVGAIAGAAAGAPAGAAASTRFRGRGPD